MKDKKDWLDGIGIKLVFLMIAIIGIIVALAIPITFAIIVFMEDIHLFFRICAIVGLIAYSIGVGYAISEIKR